MKFRFLTLILFSLFLAACQALQPTPDPTATLAPLPSPTASQAPSATPTTPAPTATATRVRPTPTPTRDRLAEAASVLTDLSIDKTIEGSPNGYCRWERLTAWAIKEEAMQKYGGQWFKYVTISCWLEDAGEVEWVLVEQWEESGLGYALPSLLGWSADGKTAYVDDAIIPDGCPPPGGFQRNLQQVDLATGAIRPIPLELTGGMALSPDTLKVAYYNPGKSEVGVYDLIAGVEQRAAFELPEGIEDWSAGNFAWSPDSQSVLFIVKYGDACFPTGVSIRRYDLQANEVSTLVEEADPELRIVEWLDPQRARIRIGEEEWWLDVNTGELEAP